MTLYLDKVHLYRFQSAVIIIGGETQQPAPYEEGNYGIFRMGTRVYNAGWNVYMYNEDGGPTVYVDGEIYDEIVTYIQDNRISNLAIAGYSHGGGSTYDISNLLNENREEITRMFYIQLTAYIDAVSQPYAGVETRWPTSSHSQSTFYQDNDWTLHGGPTAYPGYGTVYDNCHVNCLNQGCCGYGWGDLLGHTTIDDAQQVLNRIETLIPTQLVTK